MPWFVISWPDIDGNFIKQELLYRENKDKVLAFIKGRIQYGRLPERCAGFWISYADEDMIFDWDLNDDAVPSVHAIRIPESQWRQHRIPAIMPTD